MMYTFQHPLLVEEDVFNNLLYGLHAYAVVKNSEEKPTLIVHKLGDRESDKRKTRVGYLVDRYRQHTQMHKGIWVYGGGKLMVPAQEEPLEWETSTDFGGVPIIVLKERISVLTHGDGTVDRSVFNLEKPFEDSPRWYPASYFIQKQFTT